MYDFFENLRHQTILSFVPFQQEHLLYAVTAKEQEKVIGTGVIGRNPYHPYCDEIFIFVENAHRRKGVGTSLLKRLEKYSSQTLKCSVYSDEDVAVSFLQKNGFKRRRQCFEYDTSLALLCLSPKVDIVSCGSAIPAILLEQLYIDYSKNHEQVSPMSNLITKQDWYDVFLKDVTTHYCYYTLDTSAYVIAEQVDEKTIAICYIGGTLSKPDMLDFIETVLYTYQQTFDVLFVEIDSTDMRALLLQQFVGYSTQPSYDAYLKNTKNKV
ncbi:GNAT family N-acetyltransferase [Carnobacteriaceae bacterium zg-84]|uniref:GNAT family N-acetyltransferase n=1 Tax=Granulicatella sp. zg-84 TaxID=2678503 RepID=UPI0013C232FE|nr:GNAT family N-acetyltransferase [Granulicatella sp. zg-84]NEW65572.1 GNAT family N-acetyltransferase [Granulicatella sp. zg-84]QMI85548.1 GNAT family N-acetyltransferase [Carnobacteriaceae bacterium zg-84]